MTSAVCLTNEAASWPCMVNYDRTAGGLMSQELAGERPRSGVIKIKGWQAITRWWETLTEALVAHSINQTHRLHPLGLKARASTLQGIKLWTDHSFEGLISCSGVCDLKNSFPMIIMCLSKLWTKQRSFCLLSLNFNWLFESCFCLLLHLCSSKDKVVMISDFEHSV